MKRRGQAFETMMLVISVIVAVAILGILLGFIGGIGTFGADAKTVLPDLTKKVSQSGFGIQSKDKVGFTKGDRFYSKDAIGEASIAEGQIYFSCVKSDAKCKEDASDTSTAPIQIKNAGSTNKGKGSIIVNQKVDGAIAVCTKDGVEYAVVIGASINAVTKAAEDTCKLIA